METQVRERRTRKSNGRLGTDAKSLDQRKLLRVLQAVRDGDFSVRLASDQTGLAGQGSRYLQRDRGVQSAPGARAGACRADRRQGRQAPSPHGERPALRCLGRDGSLGEYPHRRPAVADGGGHAPPFSAVAKGDLHQTMNLEVDGRPPQGRIPQIRHDRQHDDRADERLHFRGDARRTRSGYRGQARRSGRSARRRRHLEGPDRQRELDGEATSPARCATSPK